MTLIKGNTLSTRPARLDTLTSLRFVAAAMIMLFHGDQYFGIKGLSSLLYLGQAVSFFFVLSGFILTYVYSKVEGRKGYLKFIWARLVRIWPAHIAVIVILCILLPFEFWTLPSDNYQLYSLFNVLLVHSWIPLAQSFFSLNAVSWSISTELFFYLLFPFLIYKWDKTWHWKLALSAGLTLLLIGIGHALSLPRNSTDELALSGLIYINPLARLLEFVIGMVACSLYRQWSSSSLSFVLASILEIGIVTIVLACMWKLTLNLDSAWITWLQGSRNAVFFGVMIIIFSFQRGVLSLLLKWRVMVFLGELSYGLYLIHTIILRLYAYHAANIQDHFWLAYCSYWILSLVFAYLIYISIETPCRTVLIGLPTKLNRAFRSGKIRFSGITAWHKYGVLRNVSFYGLLTLLSFSIVLGSLNSEKLALVNSKEVDGFPSLLNEPLQFSNELTLVKLFTEKTLNNNGLKLVFVWSGSKDIELIQNVGVHLLDNDGKIIHLWDYKLSEREISLKKGHFLLKEIEVPKELLLTSKRMGIALYMPPKDIIPIEPSMTVLSDWGHGRFLINTEQILKFIDTELIQTNGKGR